MTKSMKLKDKLLEAKNAVLLLRYKSDLSKTSSKKYFSYKKIAQVVGLTYNQVQHICRHAVFKSKQRKKKTNTERQLD